MGAAVAPARRCVRVSAGSRCRLGLCREQSIKPRSVMCKAVEKIYQNDKGRRA